MALLWPPLLPLSARRAYAYTHQSVNILASLSVCAQGSPGLSPGVLLFHPANFCACRAPLASGPSGPVSARKRRLNLASTTPARPPPQGCRCCKTHCGISGPPPLERLPFSARQRLCATVCFLAKTTPVVRIASHAVLCWALLTLQHQGGRGRRHDCGTTLDTRRPLTAASMRRQSAPASHRPSGSRRLPREPHFPDFAQQPVTRCPAPAARPVLCSATSSAAHSRASSL